jgi:hypothetical protein
MAQGRREFEGECLAYLVQMIPIGIWTPKELTKLRTLNPFKELPPESEAMKVHKAKLADLRFKAAAGGLK